MANNTIFAESVNMPVVSELTHLTDYSAHHTHTINTCIKIGKLCFICYDMKATDGVRYSGTSTIAYVPEGFVPSSNRRIMAFIRLNDEVTQIPYSVVVESTGRITQSVTQTCSGVTICGWYFLS